MVLSKYAFYVVRHDQQIALFNNLIFSPIIVTQEEFLNIKNGNFSYFNHNELKILHKKGIVVDNDLVDEKALAFFKSKLNYQLCDDIINILYIIPSNYCNLECKYCFIGKLNHEKIIIDNATINNLVDNYARYAKDRKIDKVTVLFYGAEPLVAFDAIKTIIDKFKTVDFLSVEYTLITNGTLLTQNMIDYFASFNVNIGLSIDGPKEYNDINRVYKNSNRSVYDSTIRALNMLKKSNIVYSLSITITKEILTIKKEFLRWLLSLDVKSIGFNLLHYNQYELDFDDYYKEASEFVIMANKIFQKEHIYEDRYERKRKAFFQKSFLISDCGAVGATQLCIDPHGNLTTCHGYWNSSKDNCGNINQNSFEEIINNPNRKRWKQNLTINKEKCLSCPALYICGGGCAKQAEDVFGNFDGIDKGFCLHTLASLNDLLNEI